MKTKNAIDTKTLNEVLAEMAEIAKEIELKTGNERKIANLLRAVEDKFIGLEIGAKINHTDSMTYIYEEFLKKYNFDARIKRGEFHTPDPVVEFIIRSVNQFLITHLGIKGGFSSPTITVLDPAAGTGTFLVHVLQKVRDGKYPNLVGFEVMPIPWAIARMKVESLLDNQAGEKHDASEQKILLGNALEMDLSCVKNVTVVIGNPPYSRASQNKGIAIEKLMAEYKDPVKGDRNIQALSDDYVKFIRLAQAIIDMNGSGIVGMVTNHTFLKGQIFRGMRASLSRSFDEIYVLDLHGNAKIQETIPGGVKDQNVFPIQQGTCIFFLVKMEGPTTRCALTFIHDLFGTREEKFAWLNAHEVSNISWLERGNLVPPDYEITGNTIDTRIKMEYDSFVPLDAIFPFNNVGGKPGDDELFISFDPGTGLKKIENFLLDANHGNDAGRLTEAKRKIIAIRPRITADEKCIIQYNYRPFDTRWAYFDERAWTRSVKKVKQLCNAGNVLLLSTKLVKDREFNHAFVANAFTDVIFLSNTSSTNCYIFPALAKDNAGSRAWNLSAAYLEYLASMEFPASMENLPGAIGYLYAILSSSLFKTRYQECLKHGAPRVPLIKDQALFSMLARLGEDLVRLHVLGLARKEDTVKVVLHGEGDCMVAKIKGSRYQDKRIYINKVQYIDGVSEAALEFKVGKYYVLRKWIEDRAGDPLGSDDLDRYASIVAAIDRSLVVIASIDEVIGRWMKVVPA